MGPRTAVDWVRGLLYKANPEQDYQPLETDAGVDASLNDEDEDVGQLAAGSRGPDEAPFSWFEYSIFLLLGIAMLWAWNMFLAAAPYFQDRFQTNPAILSHFQPSITSVGCITNLGSMLILSNMQAKASYPKRIMAGLILNPIVFILLAISTSWFRGVSAAGYLTFTLTMVFFTSIATGLCQNGAFAFASSFRRPEYIQAIMTGQALAGVLPSIAQILSVLALPAAGQHANSTSQRSLLSDQTAKSAFLYFMAATTISVLTLAAVFPLIRKHNRMVEVNMASSITSVDEAEQAHRKVVSMWQLYKKLHWFAAAVFACFAITMFFPVFTQKIFSVIPEVGAPRLLQPAVFIPLGFLVWNLGDLCGRVSSALPFLVIRHPVVIFVLSIARIIFIPLYLLCNIGNNGAIINSDAFYLGVVQFGFGLTNGLIGSLCMMNAGQWVDEGEREASGGFMAVNLVAGLTAGSLLSFFAADVS